MQRADTFYYWVRCGDDPIWTIDEGRDYPRLWWEQREGVDITPIVLSDFLPGSGTEVDPYLIHTAEALNRVGMALCDWDKHFRLMAHIDMSDYRYDRAVIAGEGVGSQFSGVFDGNGYTISHLKIKGKGILGLFGYPEKLLIGKVQRFTTTDSIATHDPADRATNIPWPVTLSWEPGGPGLQYDVYFGEDESTVAHATRDSTDIYQGREDTDVSSLDTGRLKFNTTYFWRIDGVDVNQPDKLWKGELMRFTTAGFIAHHHPGQYATYVPRSVILTWEPGGPGLHYDLYFGTDEDTVTDATRDSVGVYRGQQASDQTSFNPGDLESGTTYFWRIDVINNHNPQNMWKGKVWKFTTVAGR